MAWIFLYVKTLTTLYPQQISGDWSQPVSFLVHYSHRGMNFGPLTPSKNLDIIKNVSISCNEHLPSIQIDKHFYYEIESSKHMT